MLVSLQKTSKGELILKRKRQLIQQAANFQEKKQRNYLLELPFVPSHPFNLGSFSVKNYVEILRNAI